VPKRSFQETVNITDGENDTEEEEEDVKSVSRSAASSSTLVPVVELPRRTRQSSVPSKSAKKAHLETPTPLRIQETLQVQFQAISEAFNVISKAMKAVLDD
jgi:hypothetical protein